MSLGTTEYLVAGATQKRRFASKGPTFGATIARKN